MKIVDKYNSHVGTVEGLPVDCITIHNRLLEVRYNQEHHTLEDINRIYNIVNDVIRDNTASVVCIPDDVSIISMSASDFRNLMYRQLEIYKMVANPSMKTLPNRRQTPMSRSCTSVFGLPSYIFQS